MFALYTQTVYRAGESIGETVLWHSSECADAPYVWIRFYVRRANKQKCYDVELRCKQILNYALDMFALWQKYNTLGADHE